MLLLITIVSVICNLFLGIVAYRKNPRSATNRLFLILTLIIAAWAITNYISLLPSPPAGTLFWIRIIMAITGTMFPTIYLFTVAFPDKKITLSRGWLVVMFTFVSFIQLISLTPLVFKSIEIKDGVATPIPGPGMALFATNVLLFLLLSVWTLIRKQRTTIGIEKVQVRILILGMTLTFLLGTVTNFIFVVLFKLTTLVVLGPLFSLILVSFIAYAIIKHKFLDIRPIIVRSISYSFVIIVSGLVYSIIIFAVGTYVTELPINASNLILWVSLIFLGIFLFQPLRILFEKVTNHIFYKDRYDTQELLSSLSRIMSTNIILTELTQEILDTITAQMSISSGILVLIRNSSIIWVKETGKEKHPEFNEQAICYLIRKTALRSEDNMLIFEEMSESEEKNIMREHEVTMLLPLIEENEVIGAILLGEKLSGEIYSSTDVNVLKILAPEIAVAVKNALSYEEIKRFNVTLEEEVRQATSKLEEANQRLRQLDVLKDEFVSVASHELRTPMTAIKSYLWMALAGKGGNLTEKQKYYLDRAYNSTDRLIKLVNDMLNVSRIESGRVSLTLKKADMVQLVEDILAEVKPRSDEVGLTLKVDYPSQSLPPVIADVDKIKEVVINLVGNSMKFTPSGGIITIYFEVKDDTVITHVKDTGKGMMADDIPKLFQKFGLIRGSYTTNQVSQGTGLGLYICKSIVDLHKGAIWGKSEGRDKGAEFSFSLKIYNDALAAEITKEQQGKEGIDIIHTHI